MSDFQFIRFEVRNQAAQIYFNRPNVLNSFNSRMAKEVQQALQRCRDDEAIRAVLITGEGRAFCAGQDLAEAAPPDQPWPELRDFVREHYNPIVRAVRNLEKPVVCAVNGIAAGAGANLALCCDLVLAAESASFLQAFCHIGLIPDSGGTYFLPRLAGIARATAMAMLGEKIPASQALEWGMIYKVVADEQLLPEAIQLAEHLATRPTRGLGLIKRALNQSLFNSLEEQLKVEEELQGLAGESEDYREGVEAFLQKRKAKFKGK